MTTHDIPHQRESDNRYKEGVHMQRWILHIFIILQQYQLEHKHLQIQQNKTISHHIYQCTTILCTLFRSYFHLLLV